MFFYFFQVLGGMRGMTGMLWETSLLDAEEVSFHCSLFMVLRAALRENYILVCIS
jgi:hypothetical protein